MKVWSCMEAAVKKNESNEEKSHFGLCLKILSLWWWSWGVWETTLYTPMKLKMFVSVTGAPGFMSVRLRDQKSEIIAPYCGLSIPSPPTDPSQKYYLSLKIFLKVVFFSDSQVCQRCHLYDVIFSETQKTCWVLLSWPELRWPSTK